MNLVPAIRAIREEIKKVYAEYVETVKPLEEGLEHLLTLNDVCEACEGKGKVLRHRVCAEDDRPDPNDPRDYLVCPLCKGTGKANYDEAKPEETATVKGTCSNCKYHGSVAYADSTGAYTKCVCYGEKEPQEVSLTHSCKHWKLEGLQ